MSGHDLHPDRALTPEEASLVQNLTEGEVEEIDAALLSNAAEKWRKVARVVGATISDLPNHKKGIPDVYYSLRIQELVGNGSLESRGNLAHMRYSEVRLAENET
ncbi:MAG: DUF3658 domain-containing protein [Candidatus Thiodiazotropha taylori]